MPDDSALRDQLALLLDWDHAHMKFADAVKDFPAELRGKRPRGGPHSPWELLEHIRIALWDIHEFSRDAKHVSPKWPEGYWPEKPAPPNEAAWDESVAAVKKQLKDFAKFVKNPSTNLFAKIPHGDGQTVLREVLLAADHNAWHTGQLVIVRRMLGA